MQSTTLLPANYRYPSLGEGLPPGGADVLLLTSGGVTVRGSWSDSGHYLAWSPLPPRDLAKEQTLRGRQEQLRRGAC